MKRGRDNEDNKRASDTSFPPARCRRGVSARCYIGAGDGELPRFSPCEICDKSRNCRLGRGDGVLGRRFASARFPIRKDERNRRCVPTSFRAFPGTRKETRVALVLSRGRARRIRTARRGPIVYGRRNISRARGTFFASHGSVAKRSAYGRSVHSSICTHASTPRFLKDKAPASRRGFHNFKNGGGGVFISSVLNKSFSFSPKNHFQILAGGLCHAVATPVSSRSSPSSKTTA